jgi:antitoxin component YwqK of YwqJK toxin-antitoxin module
MRYLFLLLLGCFPVLLFAQQAEPKQAPMNQTDKKGRKSGLWLLQQPARMGDDAYTEFGTYMAGRKTGIWYRMDNMGQVVAIEGFRNDVLNGEVKYFEEGRLVCVGHYRGLNPDQKYDTILVMDPVTHYEKLTPIPTERGTLKHGTWRYYDAQSGRLTREEEYSVDEVISRQDFAISNRDSIYYEQRNKRLPHMRKVSGGRGKEYKN